MTLFELVLGAAVAWLLFRISKWWNEGRTPVDNDEVTGIDTSGKWFGSGERRTESETIEPFKDLKERLKKARIGHDPLEDTDDFYYGFNVKYLKEVHFIHSRAKPDYNRKIPLLVVHGWPGNVFEFYKFIPILNDPQAHGIASDTAFDVVAPSIPGYGWSEAPKKTGFSTIACAIIFGKLMQRLGYERFFLQGGDWGSGITRNVAHLFPQNSLGVHNNCMPPVMEHTSFGNFAFAVFGSYFPTWVFKNPFFHRYSLKAKFFALMAETGYMHIQGSKPDSVGTALNDSPVGLAAYILEKFSTWTNPSFKGLPDGGLTKKYTLDELLTVVTIYWFNENIVSSQRFYRENFTDPRISKLSKRFLSVPVGHAHTEHDPFDQTPAEFYSSLFNLVHDAEIADCGHFAAFEEPKKLAADFIRFSEKCLVGSF